MSVSLKKAFHKRLSIGVIISVCLLSVFVIKIERLILFNDLRDKGESIARILSSVALDAMLTHDYATMERYVKDIEKEKFVVAVSVVRSDGALLAGGSPEEADKKNIFTADYPVAIGLEEFGRVNVALSTERVDIISRNIVLAAIGIIIFLHILGIWITNLVLNKSVINPLKGLDRAIETVKSGDLRQRILMEDPDEFRKIGESFNEMAMTIQRSFLEIEESKQSLSLERAKLSAIVESIADGLFVTDITGRIISFNKSAQAITGYHEREVLGKQCEGVFRSSLCRDACAITHEGETLTNVETELVTKDGRRLIVAVSSAMLFDIGGDPVGGVQTFRDISEDKKRHELFCQTEKLAAIGQLAAGVAHEINNPLGNVIGYAKLIEEENCSDKVNQQLGVIVDEARKCSRIVKGLLDYSRSSVSEPSLIDLNELIRQITKVLKYQTEKKGIELYANLNELPYLFVDGKQMEQVIFNLLLNAIQAVGRNGKIWVETLEDNGNGVLKITDDGPGIPGDMQSRIFDPFFTTKPVGEGTGLGLSICAGIVAELGGTIAVKSKPEEGTTFKISLPKGNPNSGYGQ